MASSHLVTDGDTALAGDIDLDGLYHALLAGIVLLVFFKLFLPTLLCNLEFLGEILEDVLNLRLLLHGFRIARRIKHVGVIALRKTCQHALGDLAVSRDDLFRFAGDKTRDGEAQLLTKQLVAQRLHQIILDVIQLFTILLIRIFDAVVDILLGLLGFRRIRATINTHIHDDTGATAGNHQRTVLDIARLLTENGLHQTLFRSQIRLVLRCDLTDQNITRLHFGTDTDNTISVQIAQGFFTFIRNVSRNLFGTKLRFTGLHIFQRDMDARIDVIGHQSFADDDSVFEVVTMPRHESHQNVSSKSEFTAIR